MSEVTAVRDGENLDWAALEVLLAAELAAQSGLPGFEGHALRFLQRRHPPLG